MAELSRDCVYLIGKTPDKGARKKGQVKSLPIMERPRVISWSQSQWNETAEG